MNTPETELPRRSGLGKLVVGCLMVAGVALSLGAATPAMADSWKHNGHNNWNNGNGHWNNGHWNNGHGNKHWKKHKRHGGYYQGGYYYQPPVYYAPPPVYYAPPPPVYYYPQPVYRRPSVSIVFPFNFD